MPCGEDVRAPRQTPALKTERWKPPEIPGLTKSTLVPPLPVRTGGECRVWVGYRGLPRTWTEQHKLHLKPSQDRELEHRDSAGTAGF